ncbi:MAG TPA: cytochrome d ubiquinol oxidase subunit II [Methylomirabilota bacterium]|nr:cytochrome d ubiquinol oxidase subunit II [Methylomirabilota bacterium]
MFELWYAIVALMFAIYVALDGFDLGVGILSPLVARTDAERRQVLAAIGPYWDGNEVWLIAGGGALFLAFPRVLASGISGFYFAIFLLLWCLVGRGLAIEFRSHVADPLWRAAWDFAFAAASTLLAVFLGAAFGNLMRGVPLDGNGWFALPLFTDFTAREPVGILDWYTILTGLFALVALAGHGALFLAWKTDGPVHERSRRLARVLWIAVAVLWPVVTVASHTVNPALFPGMGRRWLAILAALIAVGGIVTVFRRMAKGAGLGAFLASAAFLLAIIGASAASYFPVMLRATGGDALSLTAYTGGGDEASLRIAMRWFLIGLPLAVLYFVIVFRLHRGKAVAARDSEGY